MARKSIAGRIDRKWLIAAAVVVALALVALVVDMVAGRDIRVWWILQDLEKDAAGTRARLTELDIPYLPAIARAHRRGGRGYGGQVRLTEILMGEPFYARGAVEEALGNDDPEVRRAAAVVLLRAGATSPAGPMPDRVLEIYREWVSHPAADYLDSGLGELGLYRDVRLVDILLPLVKERSQDVSKGAGRIGRTNMNRDAAIWRLRAYATDPRVIDVLKDLVDRDDEPERTLIQAWKALAAGGYDAEPDIYWKGARSDSTLVRQVVATNLEGVRSAAVIPILLHLLDDENEVVRRNALDALRGKRVPQVMERAAYLVEDSFDSVRGDIAMAVADYHRMDLIPLVVWCLNDNDPIVVEKAFVTLFRLTKRHIGFDDPQWNAYAWNRPISGDTVGMKRSDQVRAFINDEERRLKAIEEWNQAFPPGWTDADRVPHLIRQLGHRDSRNVKRAMRILAKITDRDVGLPTAVLDPNAPAGAEADAMHRFMKEERKAVIAEWEAWAKTRNGD